MRQRPHLVPHGRASQLIGDCGSSKAVEAVLVRLQLRGQHGLVDDAVAATVTGRSPVAVLVAQPPVRIALLPPLRRPACPAWPVGNGTLRRWEQLRRNAGDECGVLVRYERVDQYVQDMTGLRCGHSSLHDQFPRSVT